MLPKAAIAVCILTVSSTLPAATPPQGLARKAAERELASEQARAHYTYQQSVLIEEMSPKGGAAGRYQENREVIFSPAGERSERVLGRPVNTLVRLRLTEEDFRDLREIQPMLLTPDRLRFYTTSYRGEETVQEVATWVLDVKPRQILDGQRLFEGLLWISQEDFSVVQSEGRAVPQIYRGKEENLFARFRTIRKKMSNGFWFPALTVSDDVLPFRNGPLRQRMRIEYTAYQRFGADTTIQFDTAAPNPKN
jgi:hypothetical protein